MNPMKAKDPQVQTMHQKFLTIVNGLGEKLPNRLSLVGVFTNGAYHLLAFNLSSSKEEEIDTDANRVWLARRIKRYIQELNEMEQISLVDEFFAAVTECRKAYPTTA